MVSFPLEVQFGCISATEIRKSTPNGPKEANLMEFYSAEIYEQPFSI